MPRALARHDVRAQIDSFLRTGFRQIRDSEVQRLFIPLQRVLQPALGVGDEPERMRGALRDLRAESRNAFALSPHVHRDRLIAQRFMACDSSKASFESNEASPSCGAITVGASVPKASVVSCAVATALRPTRSANLMRRRWVKLRARNRKRLAHGHRLRRHTIGQQ